VVHEEVLILILWIIIIKYSFFRIFYSIIVSFRKALFYFKPVLSVRRNFKCFAGCCWFAKCLSCCSFLVEISLASTGKVIGYVKEGCSLWSSCFEILDEHRNRILTIKGPCIIFDGACCPCNNTFKVLHASERLCDSTLILNN
jgi:hypothetical protein